MFSHISAISPCLMPKEDTVPCGSWLAGDEAGTGSNKRTD